MQRVMVIGGPGAGKSTLARQLGEATGLPVTHIDRLQFQPGWIECPPGVRDEKILEVVSQDEWIIDGNYSATWPQRLARADLVIWLDIGVLRRIWRVLRRSWQFRGQTRPDLAEGCPEVFGRQTVEFLNYIVMSNRSYRGKIEVQIVGKGIDVVCLRSISETQRWLQTLRQVPPT